MGAPVPFTTLCYKTSTVSRHSDAVSHTAAVKRGREADWAKNNATEGAQLQGEQEPKELLKSSYFVTENEFPN